jgi:hypothetical protein
MNPEVGSIMKFIYDLFPVKVYTKKVPMDFQVPSLYVPSPFSFDGNDTTSTFSKTYNLNIKLFHKDTSKAMSEAERIADVIRGRRNVIPLLDEKGAESGDFVRFSRIETREGDEGVASIVLDWTSRYYYDKPSARPAEYFNFENGVKE